mgnify:CR=1 FL=1|tara:strand:+ start:19 stop:507 length:489 start_codon:yes stop_codon:yes gene_type:complete
MASELRVDRIIPVDGVPTGGAGGVIQMKHSVATSQVANSTTSYVSTGNTVTITPKSATNYFYVFFEGQFGMQANQAQGFGYNIYKDGTAVTTSPRDTGDRPYDEYKDETRIFTRMCKMYFGQTGTTNSVTFDVRFKSYNSQSVKFGWENETQGNLIVMEVSG